MYRRLVMASVAMVLAVVGSAMAQQPEAPKVNSWPNSKTGDQKTVFAVKPGDKITFSVKADGAEKYVWLVDKVVQKTAGGAAFEWTVPNKKGMWKILVKTTNHARREWVKDRAALWNKWMSGKEKEKFIRDMIDLNVYPVKGQTEWIVATFLKKVEPGQSIQKAIDSLPPEGGIVELAPGTHEINDTMYPPGSFRQPYRLWYKNRPVEYSIIIKRSNVAICGTRKSIVRHHNKYTNCFLVPDLEAIDPNLYVENITFRGFTVASTYTRKDRVKNAIIAVSHVKNLTVEDIHDTTSYGYYFVAISSSQGHIRLSKNIIYRNNITDQRTIMAAFADDVHILDNTVKRGGIYTDRNERHVHIIGNYVRGTGGNKCLTTDGNEYWEVRDNNCASSQSTIWIQQGARQVIVANNTLTGTSKYAILLYPQGALDNVIIVNNRIFNNSGHGIYSQEYHRASGHGTVRIINNIIYNNGKDGIRTNTERQTLIVSNNIIADNKGYGINPARGKIVGKYNNLWNNAKGNYNGCAAGPGDFSKDPLFADSAKGDFHLKSKAGRWNPKAKKWVKDKVHSPCIDAGDPKAGFSREPVSNGGRVNVGAYGNTAEASKSIKK